MTKQRTAIPFTVLLLSATISSAQHQITSDFFEIRKKSFSQNEVAPSPNSGFHNTLSHCDEDAISYNSLGKVENDTLAEKTQKPFLTNYYKFGIHVWGGLSLANIVSHYGIEAAYQNCLFGFHRNDYSELNLLISPQEYNRSYTLYGGLRKSGKYTSVSLTGGVGAVEIRKRTTLISNGLISSTYDSETYNTFGVEFALKGNLTLRNNGIGIMFNANINPIESFFGAYLFIQAGWGWNAKKVVE
jgi:hypothetical protein